MVETNKIECDECSRNLTYTGNCEDYYIVLGNASKSSRNAGIVTLMAISPPLKRTHHFCGLTCLDQWRDRARYREKLWTEWSDRWRDEHGHKSKDGRVMSWPSAPDEIREAQKVKIDKAALFALPVQNRG